MGSAAASLGGSPRAKVLSWLASLGAVVAIALVFRTLFIQGFRVPTESMAPTIIPGDVIIALKYPPRIRIRPVERARSQVVVFRVPDMHARDPVQARLGSTLVKRIAALPGDTVLMRRGLLFVNGDSVPQGPTAISNPKGDPEEGGAQFDWQNRHAVVGTRFGPPPQPPTHDDWGPLLVPQGHYFLLGDNRYRSRDSRYWGFVRADDLIGRAALIVFSCSPLPDGGRFLRMGCLRWGRVGRRIG